MDKYAIIVAGGSGSRMKSEIPKQFIVLGKLPILMHTIQAFLSIESIKIVLALPENQIAYWHELCKEYHFNVDLTIAKGGVTRFESVKNALHYIPNDVLVAIHDGVRPFVSKFILENSFNVASKSKTAITCISLKDSIRKIISDKSISQNRDEFKLIQTPQTFQSSVIKKAYLQNYVDFTDDASVAEAAGYEINLIDGSYENIKITTPEDLIVGNAYLSIIEK